jgi:phospholipid/cholesterol/gamma-HCH transport system substrate-binding protein
MESKVNYTAVGAFVIAMVMALAGAVWWLSTGARQVDTTTYLIYATDNVNGLSPASDVLYRGVAVGRVSSIEIDPRNPTLIRIQVAIKSQVPVRRDTVAQLSPRGVTGLSVINLSGGHSEQPLLPQPGHPYAVIQYAPSVFSRLEGGLNDAAVTLSKIATRLDVLLSPANVRAISETLRHVERTTAELDSHRQDIGATLDNLRQGSEELAALGQQGRQLGEHADATLQQVRRTAASAQAALTQLELAAQDWQRAGRSAARLGDAGTQAAQQLRSRTLPDYERLGAQLQSLSRQLTELSRSLQHNPNQLLFGAPLPPAGPGEH